MKIVISSGHGKLIRGASGYIDEVDEARRVVNKVAEYVNNLVGCTATVFHDDISENQDDNLHRIVDFHNDEERDLDVSVHFNAYETTEDPMGCECLYATQTALAGNIVDRICDAADFENRGAKKRTDLYFLNNTDEPAVLIEVCFVDSQADVDLYYANFEAICQAISEALTNMAQPPLVEPPPSGEGPESLSELLTIDGVTIYQSGNGNYVKFTSDLDICNDGTGPSYGDPSYQSQTAYYNGGKFLNADKDQYLVIPPQIRSMVPPVVMGCQGRVTNIETNEKFDAVTGEIGPDNKTGEAAYCLAKKLNPTITHNSGDGRRIYLYELWPGKPAVVGNKTYKLEPAGG